VEDEIRDADVAEEDEHFCDLVCDLRVTLCPLLPEADGGLSPASKLS
jgi:hypothetical protein